MLLFIKRVMNEDDPIVLEEAPYDEPWFIYEDVFDGKRRPHWGLCLTKGSWTPSAATLSSSSMYAVLSLST